METNERRRTATSSNLRGSEILNNNCDERSFSQNKAEDGEEGHDKPPPQQPIERTKGPDGSNNSIKENPKQIKYLRVLLFQNTYINVHDKKKL